MKKLLIVLILLFFLGASSALAESQDDDRMREELNPETIDAILSAWSSTTCINIEDGKTCPLPPYTGDEPGPRELIDKMGIRGVCCSGKCMINQRECPAAVDLIIEGMETSPEFLAETLKIEEVRVTIRNKGSSGTKRSFWLTFSRGGGLSPIFQEIEPLEAGEETTVFLNRIPAYPEKGAYLLEAIVDSNLNSLRDNVIEETDEENNHAEMTVFMGENLDVCGNQICEEGEVESCPEDCEEKIIKEREMLCGDGFCEDWEIDSCPEDCEEEILDMRREKLCGNSICEDWEPDTCPGDCEEKEGADLTHYILLAGLSLLVLLLAFIFFFLRKKKNAAPDDKAQIAALLKEKKTIEEMMDLAKSKYHKRKLDEESFKEIVKDNQKKLIEIETRINDLTPEKT